MDKQSSICTLNDPLLLDQQQTNTLHGDHEVCRCSLDRSPRRYGLFEDYVTKVSDFFDAIVAGNDDKFCELLNSCVQPNIRYNGESTRSRFEGDCGVHAASRVDNVTALALLCSAGADVDRMNRNRETSLHIASALGNEACVAVLLLYRATVDVPDREGETALMLAIKGFDPDNKEQSSKFRSITNMLLQAGADPNWQDNSGHCALHITSTKTDISLTELVLSYGSVVNVPGSKAMSPLLKALHQGRHNIAQLLLTHGANVNDIHYLLPSQDILFPLQLAVNANNLTLMLDLLDRGAKTSGNLGNIAMFAALRRKRLVMLLLLLSSGGDVCAQSHADETTLILFATKMRCHFLVRFLLARGADLNQENSLGTTPIWAAVRMNDVVLVKLFLRHNCDLDIISLEFYTYRPITPIQVAFEMGHFEVARLLLQAGCTLKPTWVFEGPKVPRMLKHHPEEHEYFQNWLLNPPSLKFLARKTLRNGYGTTLPRMLRLVVFPSVLRKYVLCIGR